MTFDVAIIGGGPAGLSAALALGRARKRVLLLDAGPRRNAAATHIHNFVTRDGTPPDEFRKIGRAQLATYPNVQIRDQRIASIEGEKGAFVLQVEGAAGGADSSVASSRNTDGNTNGNASATITASRILLCTGMIDEHLPIDGFAELWGHAIFQCPYCHGWEVQDKAWGVIAREPMSVPFAIMLRGWTKHVTFFAGGPGNEFTPSAEQESQLLAAGIGIERAPIEHLRRREQTLQAVVLAGGKAVPCEALFVHPPQRQVALVASLGLGLDDHGFVKIDSMTRETSRPGVYAAGDVTTRAQGAIMAAATGTQAAGMINHELTAELVAKRLV